jgi:hypothetical protein
VKHALFNGLNITTMAKTSPRRNQWTGPVRPTTPPTQIDPLELTI